RSSDLNDSTFFDRANRGKPISTYDVRKVQRGVAIVFDPHLRADSRLDAGHDGKGLEIFVDEADGLSGSHVVKSDSIGCYARCDIGAARPGRNGSGGRGDYLYRDRHGGARCNDSVGTAL